ncbi:hypothetical protein KIN20_027586 [Parelaphostrongylus tenuis]|uniref:PH domain-containing protein n=1 Tax=Parelaphostrongylus tenuis TaxID=148309 RepID=A0AAD5WE25_PARTN|nr:hypothetical protein KIN20_027586 [Parelaphostrongylus tenuis]
MEGWLIRSRERTMHFPPFKSKWVRRYFVQETTAKVSSIWFDVYRSILIFNWRIQSCSTTSRFGGFQWIFSLYFTKELSPQKKTPLYFVSESEEKMKDWVYHLCRACHLEKENDEDNNSYIYHQHHSHVEAPSHRSTIPSSIGGLSIYSDRSSESMIDTPRNEVIGRDYEKSRRHHPRWRNYRHDIAERNIPPRSMDIRGSHLQRNRKTESLEGRRHSSSPSVCSSVTSERRSNEGDDDSTSCISQLSTLSCGPPIPPRSRLMPQNSSASSSTGVPVKRPAMDFLSQMAFTPSHSIISETKDNDSSGETIKMHSIATYANSSQCSSDDRLRAPSVFQPPVVDRSNKPAKLRLYDYEDEKMAEEMTIHGYNKSGSNFTRIPRTPQTKSTAKYTYMREPPQSAGPLGRSRELDYFHPVVTDRAQSMRSPVSSDIEYIKIDAEKTQAVKQSIAQRTPIE